MHLVAVKPPCGSSFKEKERTAMGRRMSLNKSARLVRPIIIKNSRHIIKKKEYLIS